MEKRGRGDMNVDDERFKCRFYEKKYPDVDEVVMVKVNEIAEMGAYVSLLEYNDIEGMILFSELSRRRIRAISKFIRVGKQEVVQVLRVNEEKGYIDLSKSRVTPEERHSTKLRYEKAGAVHNIFFHVAIKCDCSVLELYEKIGWPLYKKYQSAFDSFKLIANGKEEVLKDIKFPSDKVKKEFLTIVKKRLKPQDLKLRADIELTCLAFEGINAIKKAIRAGEGVETGTSEKIKITLVAPPLYVMMFVTNNKQKGIKLLEEALSRVKESIMKDSGKIVVKSSARVVSAKDDKSFNLLLQRLEEQNREVSGDDDATFID